MYAPVRRFYNALQLVEVSHTNVTCFDGNDGSITVLATGGKAPYQYSMDESFSTYNTDGVFSGLSITGPVVEGEDEYGGTVECTKTVYVRDAKSNVTSLEVTLKSPVQMAWIFPDDIYVYCDDGENYATVIFDEPTLTTYTNNATISIIGNNKPVDNHYNIGETSLKYTTNRTGCGRLADKTLHISVLQGTPLTLTEDATAHQDCQCYNSVRRGTKGSITVEASGGVAPYIYSTDPTFASSQQTGVFNNLTITGPITEDTDEYGDIITCEKTFYVKDANNIVASITCTLKAPGQLGFATFPEDVTLYCDAGQNYATYTFAKPTLTTYANNPVLSVTLTGAIVDTSLPSDNHYPIGTTTVLYSVNNTGDVQTCGSAPSPQTFTITVLPRVTLTEATVDHHDVTCFDGGDGSITVTAQGDYGPFIYSMDENFSTYNSTGVFDNLAITGPVTESTDEYGGILICTKRIYVKDSQNNTNYLDVELKSPVELEWLNVPQDMTEYCDAGENYATVVYTEPQISTTNNVEITISETGTVIRTENEKTNNHYPVGSYTISYGSKNRTCRKQQVKNVSITVLPNNE